jgi:hypothetical protein
MVAFHKEFRVSPTIAGESMYRNKIPETLKSPCLCARSASGFVESAINQVVSKRMVKKQQMGWSQRGAHLLLPIRTRVLDEEWENTFRRWYPDFHPQGQAKKSA